jgi:hypothetical protein
MLFRLRTQPREDTGHSPAKAVFGASIVWLNEFLQNEEMSVDTTVYSKIFQKLCMFLLFLCPGTILASSCQASCQPSSSLPPSSGSVGAVSYHPFSRSITAPMPSCAAAPALSPSKLGPGTRLLPLAVLRLARPRDATPGSQRCRGRLPGSHPCGPATTKRVSFSDPLVSSPSPPAPPRDGPGTVFLPSEEVSRCPGLAVPSQVPQTRAVPIPSTGTATEVGPLTSSPPG